MTNDISIEMPPSSCLVMKNDSYDAHIAITYNGKSIILHPHETLTLSTPNNLPVEQTE